MGQFQTSLDVRRLEDTSQDGRGTWQLLAQLLFLSAILPGLIVVPVGFVTDFASLPWFVPAGFLRSAAPAAAALHDWLYTAQLCDRRTADAIMREACMACGMKKWRAWSMWAGVRVGGASHWKAPATPQPKAVEEALA